MPGEGQKNISCETRPLLQLKQVTKCYAAESAAAVDRLEFSIEAGEIYGLLGPNGAGKSTTVAMICGLIQPDSGEIIRHYRKLGLAPQEIALFPTLTAHENLHYFGNLYGLHGEGLRQRIDTLLHQFLLQDKAHKQVHTLSGGMKRRVNLMAALLHHPDLLILDEPTAGVDVQSRNLIVEILRSLNESGMTILYSSHLMEEAQRLCSKVGIMDSGKLIEEGEPGQMIAASGAQHLEDLFLKLTGKSNRE